MRAGRALGSGHCRPGISSLTRHCCQREKVSDLKRCKCFKQGRRRARAGGKQHFPKSRETGAALQRNKHIIPPQNHCQGAAGLHSPLRGISRGAAASGLRSIPTFISVNEIAPSERGQERSSRPGQPVARVCHGGALTSAPPAPIPPPWAPSPGLSSRSAPCLSDKQGFVAPWNSAPLQRGLNPNSPHRGGLSCPPGALNSAGTAPRTWPGQRPRDAPGRVREMLPKRREWPVPGAAPQGAAPSPRRGSPCPSLALILEPFPCPSALSPPPARIAPHRNILAASIPAERRSQRPASAGSPPFGHCPALTPVPPPLPFTSLLQAFPALLPVSFRGARGV